MKKWLNIILLATDWEFYHTKDYILSKGDVFSNWSDILVIQLPVSFCVHMFTKFRMKIIGLLKGKYKPFKIHDNITVFTPKILFHPLFWNKCKITFHIDILFYRYQLNSFIEKTYGAKNIIQWVFHPIFYILTREIKYNILVYDYQDNFNYDIDGNYLPDIAQLNHNLERISDIVFCTAKAMYNDAIQFNPNSYYIRNAGNFELISNTGIKGKNILKQFNKPIIGYAGGIRDWIDFELVEMLIKQFTECYIIFIGLLDKSVLKLIKKLKQYPNFIYLKYMPFKDLVVNMKHFDVGIIPFRVNRFFEGVFPNKFFEYMAAQIPIVTTALPELKEFKDYIGYSETNSGFIDYCKQILNGDFKDKMNQYRSIAAENSWQKKAEKVNGIITGYIKEKF